MPSLTEMILNPIALILTKVTVLLAIAWAFQLCLANANPRWRVLLWRLVLTGGVLIVVAQLTLPGPKLALPVVPGPIAESLGIRAPMASSPDSGGPIATVAAPIPNSAPAKLHFLPLAINRAISWSSLLFWAWVIVTSILIARRWLTGRRLRRHLAPAHTPSSTTRDLAIELASALGLRRDVDVRLVEERVSPFIVGVFRPRVVLPAHLEGRTMDLRAALAHELTHLRANDLIWMNASRWIGALLWFHPLVWRIDSAQGAACEEVADAEAAGVFHDPKQYSRSLARLALELGSPAPSGAGASFLRSGGISRRLQLLQRGCGARRLGGVRLAFTIAIAIVASLALGCLRVSQESQIERRERLVGYWQNGETPDRPISLVIENGGSFRFSFLDASGSMFLDSGMGYLNEDRTGRVFIDQHMAPLTWQRGRRRGSPISIHVTHSLGGPRRVDTFTFGRTADGPGEAEQAPWSWLTPRMRALKMLEDGIEAYAAEHGEFPDPARPELLTPYLVEIPADPSSTAGEPLRWALQTDPPRAVLYFYVVGDNGIDDGGGEGDLVVWTLYGLEE